MKKIKNSFLFNSNILEKIREIVKNRQAKSEKITITRWLEEACELRLKMSDDRFRQILEEKDDFLTELESERF